MFTENKIIIISVLLITFIIAGCSSEEEAQHKSIIKKKVAQKSNEAKPSSAQQEALKAIMADNEHSKQTTIDYYESFITSYKKQLDARQSAKREIEEKLLSPEDLIRSVVIGDHGEQGIYTRFTSSPYYSYHQEDESYGRLDYVPSQTIENVKGSTVNFDIRNTLNDTTLEIEAQLTGNTVEFDEPLYHYPSVPVKKTVKITLEPGEVKEKEVTFKPRTIVTPKHKGEGLLNAFESIASVLTNIGAGMVEGGIPVRVDPNSLKFSISLIGASTRGEYRSIHNIQNALQQKQEGVRRKKQADKEHFEIILQQANLGVMKKYLESPAPKWHEKNALAWMRLAIDESKSYVVTNKVGGAQAWLNYLKSCNTPKLQELAASKLYTSLEHTKITATTPTDVGQESLLWIKGGYLDRLYGIPENIKKRYAINLEGYRQKSFTQFIVDYTQKAEINFLKPAPLSMIPLPEKPAPSAYGDKPPYPSMPVLVKGEFEKTVTFEKRQQVELAAWEQAKKLIDEKWSKHIQEVDEKNVNTMAGWKEKVVQIKLENKQKQLHHDTIEAKKPAQLEKFRKKWKREALLLALGSSGPLLSIGSYDADQERFDISISTQFFDLGWEGELQMKPTDAKKFVEKTDNRKMNKNLVGYIQVSQDELIGIRLVDLNFSNNVLKTQFNELPSINPVKMENRLWTEVKQKNTSAAYDMHYTAYHKGVHAEEALWNSAKLKNTKDGYQEYIKAYPKGLLAQSKKSDFLASFNIAKKSGSEENFDTSQQLEIWKKFFDNHQAEFILFDHDNEMYNYAIDKFFTLKWEKEKAPIVSSFKKAKKTRKGSDWKISLKLLEKEFDGTFEDDEMRIYAKAQPEYLELESGIGVEFVKVESGCFEMGREDNSKYGQDNELPSHKVCISSPFFLSKTEVTQTQWIAVMGNNPSKFKGSDNPVESVSWNDVQTFIQRLNKKEGGSHYRLPTEAEWEYAARAGSSTVYSFGDAENILSQYAWYNGNSGRTTHPVAQKKPNPWGLYDMHGNVDEWCQDRYDEDYYRNSPTNDPTGHSSGRYRVRRGGSWNNSARNLRSANRNYNSPGYRYNNLGFRLLRTPW